MLPLYMVNDALCMPDPQGASSSWFPFTLASLPPGPVLSTSLSTVL